MIEKVIKRDGRIEDFCPDKMNRWAKWSIKEINNGLVDWSEIVIEVMKQSILRNLVKSIIIGI